jgi:hypothetical protein
MHAMIDVETNQALGLEITDKFVQDDQKFIPLLDQTQQHCGEEHPVHRVLADGACDRNELFNTLEQRGIASGIKIQVDAAMHSTGSPYRAECVRDRNRWGGYRMWSLVATYGMRWKVEGFFSNFKRIFGEGVQATSQEGMFREIRMKMNCYNRMLALAGGQPSWGLCNTAGKSKDLKRSDSY